MEASVLSSIKDQVLALIGSGNIDEAISILREACNNDPDNALVHTLLGVAYQNKNDKMHSIYHFEEALRLDETAKNYYNLGTMYESSHRTDEAIRQYNMALDKDGEYTRAKNALDRLRQTYMESNQSV